MPEIKRFIFILLFVFANFIEQSFAFDSYIVVKTPTRNVNRFLLGNNVQWVDNGDDITDSKGSLKKDIVDLLNKSGVSMLRYPGGSLSDNYHWQDGIGEINSRPIGFNSDNTQKTIVFGTDEFLKLAKILHSEPVITVNVPSGTASEAAKYVEYTNKGGASAKGLPPVHYWEIGNEPYLKSDKIPELNLSPQEYATRFTNFAAAMRTVDPSIKIGLPLRADKMNNIPVTAYPNFNDTVLSGIGSAAFDFVSLHYYFPFLGSAAPTNSDIYWAYMGASEVMRKDIIDISEKVKAVTKKSIPVAITEYNSVLTIGEKRDSYIYSLTSAIMVADMLRVFTEMPNVEFANFWSTIGNWYFGMIESNGNPRASYFVMDFYSKLLNGKYLGLQVSSPTFDVNSVGLVPAATALPLVTAVATASDAAVTHLLIINKSMNDVANINVSLNGAKKNSIHSEVLTGDSPLSGSDGESKVEIKKI